MEGELSLHDGAWREISKLLGELGVKLGFRTKSVNRAGGQRTQAQSSSIHLAQLELPAGGTVSSAAVTDGSLTPCFRGMLRG